MDVVGKGIDGFSHWNSYGFGGLNNTWRYLYGWGLGRWSSNRDSWFSKMYVYMPGFLHMMMYGRPLHMVMYSRSLHMMYKGGLWEMNGSRGHLFSD